MNNKVSCTLEKPYQPSTIEPFWQSKWMKRNSQANLVIKHIASCFLPPMLPADLHMGHGFQHTLMDILTRFERMKGKKTLWQPGTDHAGIATQMVVERQLNEQNLTKDDLGREEFIKRVWQWKEESGNTICKQMQRLGTL